MLTQGTSPEVDPERWPDARYIVAWGWNPQSTAPHLWRFIVQARTRGARLVVIDPYRKTGRGDFKDPPGALAWIRSLPDPVMLETVQDAIDAASAQCSCLT